jgi:hypothetical protein
MIRIPDQLKEFEIILLRKDEPKRPAHKWQDHTGGFRYKATDWRVLNHLAYGGGYAIYCSNQLAVIDADEPELLDAIKQLPETFAVRTGGGGLHFYYKTNLDKKIIIYKDEKHLGEIQAGGRAYVVGPGSRHPNGNRYEVINDIELAYLSEEEIKDWIQRNGFTEKKKQNLARKEVARQFSNTLNIPVTDFLYPDNARRSGDEIYGSHPIHGSTTGQNFWVNEVKNTWYCFRCESGGGPIEAFAVAEGIIDCSEAGPDCFSKDQFKEILKMLKERGYHIPEVVGYNSLLKKAKREFKFLVSRYEFLTKKKKRR